MTLIASRHELAETIAEIINLHTLDVYRECGAINFNGAKQVGRHLRAVGKKISDMLEEAELFPQPDEFEPWLLEKRKGEQLATDEQAPAVPAGEIEEVETNPVLEPDTPECQTTDKDPDADPEPCAQAATNDDLPSKPDSGGELVPKKLKVKRKGKKVDVAFFDLLKAWIKTEDLSNCEAGRRAGVSDVTILNLVSGHTKYPTKPTKKKILAAIRKTKKSTATKPVAGKHNGTGGRGAAEYIQTKLKAWLEDEDLDAAAASGALMVQEHALRSILAGHMPHSNIVMQLAKYIPAISAQQGMLMAAAEQREAA